MKPGTKHVPFDNGFIVKSGIIRVSDPCYTLKSHESLFKRIKALNGRWLASLEMIHEGRSGIVAALTIHHETLDHRRIVFKAFTDLTVGVDSGQMGFFDEGEYGTIPPVDHDTSTGRYEELGNLTLSDTQGGVIDCGVVSSSGRGDGEYNLFIQLNEDGDAVAARVVFIEEDEEEIDEEDDEGYEDEENDED